MVSVFAHTLRSHRTGLFAVSVGLFLMSLIIVYTFDAFGGLEAFADLFESLPAPMTAMFRAQGGFGTSLTSYIALDYRHPVYIIAGLAFVLSVSSGAAAREIERGTALMLLASPIARWRYLAAKIGALVVGAVVIVTMSWLGSLTGALLTGLSGEVEAGTLLLAQVNELGVLVASGGIAVLLSAMNSDGGRTVSIAAGILTVMYFLDFVGAIWGPAEPLAPLSLFYYFDPLAVATDGSAFLRDVAVLFGVGLVGFVAALVVFQRRDITR
ncbi:MAG: ABC transporter permease subunit [Chloroflexota bacterium]|nr:ABC transporter permease subunit [Chloroflexota bacterium]MDE2884231.1 ABC transporter permease subunit [Chloroflexota bacterium]